MDRRRAAGALLALAACIACSTAAPMASNHTALDMYEGTMEGCYYNFQHYGEGDRIMTNEPCLNCTCHNRMLMCYLRVCPFTKAIGQDCTVEKRADQCCPIVTCPDVPVDLLTSTSTSSPAEYGATGIGKQDKYGCSINGRYFSEGSKVPPTPNKPCEHCYCIRNMTTCVMQECTLHVDGCIPIYHKDVCCPVRYSCDHPEDEIPLLDDMSTTVRPTPGFLLTTTTLAPVTQASQDCVHNDQIFADGALLKTQKACEHCYCMKGDIVCVMQECGTPMENAGKNCTSLPPRHGQCCPDTYICEVNELTTEHITELTTNEIFKTTSSTPPRRGGVEGSGYRIEPDETYTDMPVFDIIETEGSGEDQSVIAIDESETVTTGKQTPDLTDEMFLTTSKIPEAKPFTSTIEPDIEQTSIPKLSSEHKKPEISGAEQTTLYESNIATESSKPDIFVEEGQTTDFENKEMETTIITEDDKVNNIATETSKPNISAEEEQTTDSKNKEMETTITIQDDKVTGDLSMTTKSTSDYVSSSLSDSLTSKEVQYGITTEPTLRKEDDFAVITKATTQKGLKEITTENEYYGQKGTTKDGHETIFITTASPENNYHKLETIGVHDIENSFQTEQTTTNISFDVSTKPESDKDFKESTNEYISFSTIKPDFDETTIVNPIENEIEEDMSHSRIPGEGDCLRNGITYKNNTTVPSTNKCQTSCRCVSSIVKCDPIICSPPPEYENIMSNCQPVYDSVESCCPTYICDQPKETILPEVHSQMSGTDNPRPVIAYECNGNECEETEDKQTPPPKQHEPCTSENCIDVVREKQPDCGENECENAGKAPILPIKHTEDCADGKCDQTTTVKPCESGDCLTQNENTAKEDLCQTQGNCKNVQSVITDEKSCEGGICTTDISLENQVSTVEKECKNGNCRRKVTSEVATKLPSAYNTENKLTESTTEPLIFKDTTTNIKDFSSIIAPKFTTTMPDTKTDTVLEQGTDTYDTSSQKIDVSMQELTTKYPEHLQVTTESDLKIELESFTSMKPNVEKIPDDDVGEYGASTEVSASQNAISEKEYLTTPSFHISPEPALAEANSESDQKQANVSDHENTTLNEQSKTSNIDSHLTTISDLIETPKLPTTSTLEYTISDHEKDLSLTEIENEITTPQNIDTDLKITETYDTKPLDKQDEKDKEYYDKDVTTTNILLFDNEYTTETSVSKTEDTGPKLSEKISTMLPESHEYADKTTDGTLIYTTKNIIELDETTKQPIDNIDTQTESKTSTEVSSALTTSIHRESTTENNEESELPLHVSTEQTLEYSMEEKSTTTTPEIQKYETKEPQTTEMPESYLTKEITSATKTTNAEESFTELPVATTKETENDLMESLNGRGTELPVSGDVDEKQSETTHSHETDLYTKISEIGSGFEEAQTENISQSTLEANISTKMPEHFETETIEIVTDSPTLIITQPVKTDTGLSLVSQEKDNNEGISTISTLEQITTQIPESLEHHLFDKKVDEVKETETILEITIKPDLSSTEQVEGQSNIQTDSDSDTHKVTTTRPYIIQTDEDMPTTPDKEYNAPEYETELSTSKTYPKVEENTEIYTENSIDITKQAEQQGSDEVYSTIRPTEISDEMLTTYKQDLPISVTTMLPGTSSENILHTFILKEKEEVTESSLPLVTEDMSIKTSPKETINEFTTLVTPQSDENTSKLQLAEESITDVPEITTKGISKIEDIEKSTITFTHDVINKVEEDIHSKVTTIPNITDKSTPSYSEIVTQDVSNSSDLYDDTKATTDISENMFSHMVTESEPTGDLNITVINEEGEITTKEPTNDKQTYTETPMIITENNNLTLRDKDKTTVIPDLGIPSKSELSETQVYKAPDAPSTQDNIKTTEIPNLSTSGEQHIITEKSEQTRVTTPVVSIQLEDNMNKIEETTKNVITELPEKATETEDNEKVTDILVATEKLEYITEKTSTSPAVEYIEKVIETTEQAYTGEIIAESPGKSTDFAGKDILYSTVAPQKEVTVSEEIATEVKDVYETLVTITPDQKNTEGILINFPESETEGVSVLSKLDKEMFTEIPSQGGTEKPATLTLETSTKQLPESPTVDNEERSTPAGEVATVVIYTELPQLVTDNIRDSENVDKDQKLAEIPENTATTPSKLPEDVEKETEVTNIHYQDKTTDNPEKYTFESTTLILEHHDVRITTEKPFNVPIETSSYLEISTNDKNDGLSDEKYTTSSTEVPETLLSKLADMDKNKLPTETIVIDSTTKSPVNLPDTSITETTESAVEKDKNDLSENFIPITSFEFINITGKPDQGKTVTAVPDLHATQPSVSDVSDDATELIWTGKYETTLKTEADEKELPDKVKVSSSSEDKISTDTTDEYTKSPEETFTEIHKDYLVTDHDIFITEKSKTTDEIYSHEHYTPIITTTKPHLEELETKLPVFSSMESQLSGSTEELRISDGDITKAPEGNQYTTESNAIDTHILHEQTIYQETIQTESPATVVTSSDGIQYSHDVTINLPKETHPDDITEKVDLSTKSNVGVSEEITTESNVLESKPIDETSKLPEYPKEMSKPKHEYAESTPYFVELEEHTHKSIQETEVTSEVYHEEKTSTLSSEVQFTVKEQTEITTSKQMLLDQEKLTENSIKEMTREDQEKTTPASDLGGLDIFYSTSTEQSIQTERVTTPTKHTAIPYDKETSTYIPIDGTMIYEKQETPKYDEHVTTISEKEKENSKVTYKPHDFDTPLHETSASEEEEFIPAVSKITTAKITEDVTTLSPIQFDNFTKRDEKPIEAVHSTPHPELPKPGFNEVLPTDDLLPTDEDNNFPHTGTSGYGQEPDYIEEDQAFGPGTCRYGGKVYVSAQQIPRDDPCDFCFCFRSDIICLQQSCPPPIHGCHEEPIQGFCCPRYECPVSMATTLNLTTTTTTTTTTLPPHFLPHAYKGAAQRRGCQIKGHTYKVGEVVRASSGPCLHCTCGGDGQMKCDPKACTPEPMLRQMIAAAVSAKRRR